MQNDGTGREHSSKWLAATTLMVLLRSNAGMRIYPDILSINFINNSNR